MITKPEAMTFDDKRFSMIIYGSPGVGKTTLALSSPNPVLIDFDRGMSRVRVQHRKAAIFCNTYEEVLKDLQSPDMAEFETVVVDTGGSFVTFLQDYVMRQNPAQNKQKNGALSSKGFGAVKTEFNRFTSYVKDTLNKNLIYVFHSQEQPDRDGNPQQRLLCEGSTRNLVWTPCDFGGYVQMIWEQRYICFTPEQEFFAKGCHGINGKILIPNLGQNDSNDFVTKLFDKAKSNISAESEAFAPVKAKYAEAMQIAVETISGVTDIESANMALHVIAGLDHALTSAKESKAALTKKTAELGLVYSKSAEGYVKKE